MVAQSEKQGNQILLDVILLTPSTIRAFELKPCYFSTALSVGVLDGECIYLKNLIRMLIVGDNFDVQFFQDLVLKGVKYALLLDWELV